MKKNTFKKVLSIAIAAIMGMASMTSFPVTTVTAAEAYSEPTPIYALSTTTTAPETVTTWNTDEGKVDDLTCTPDHHELMVGQTAMLELSWKTGEAFEETDLTFEFADYECIEIEKTADPDIYVITATKTGRTTVFVRTPDGKAGFFTVNVTEPPTTTTATTTTTRTATLGLTCSPETVKVIAGSSKTVELSYNGVTYSGSIPTFTVEDESIASVKKAGYSWGFKVVGLSEGTTVITITDAFGNTGVLPVTVTAADYTTTEPPAVTTTCDTSPVCTTETTTETTTVSTDHFYTTTESMGIQLACSPSSVTVTAGERASVDLYYKTGPTSFSSGYPVTFEIEDESIAKVTESDSAGTYYIEGLAEGTTNITVSQMYGLTELTYTLPVTVTSGSTAAGSAAAC